MTTEEALIQVLAEAPYPADRAALARFAAEHDGPDVAVEALEKLPGDREYASVKEVQEVLAPH